MKYKNLPKSFSRQFQDMNTYTRAGKPAKWEQDFLKEQSGISYEEDKQTYKRLQEFDDKYEENTAEYYEHFHCLWYWDNSEADWTKELRSNRRKDIFGNMSRVDLMLEADQFDKNDDSYDVEASHNSGYGLEDLEKTADIIPIKRLKTHMSAQDYQYTINPYANRWADLVIDSIDRSRNVREDQEVGVGLIRVRRGESKLGYEAVHSGLYIATMVFPDGSLIRESFKDVDLARIFLEEKRSEYQHMAFSWGVE